MTKELSEKEADKLYDELGELDEKVKQASEDLAYVWKRRQQIYKIFGW